MTHLKNAPMTQVMRIGRISQGAKIVELGLIVSVALDGDVVLLAKRARPSRSRRTNDIRLEGQPQ